jgi:hypothetical protein
MANEINIKSFSAADIERYYKGLLSPKERHALEKAALDDPFLADALEGFPSAGVNLSADITDLKNRLANRVEQEKPIMIGGAGSSFPWLRAAAIIILIAGGGLLVYQFAFNNKKGGSLAVTNNKKPEVKPQVPVDSIPAAQPGAIIPGTESLVTTTPQNGRTVYLRDSHVVGSTLANKSKLLGDSGYTESTVFNKVSTIKTDAPEIPRTIPARTDSAEAFTLNDVSVNRGEVKDKVIDLKKDNNTTPSGVFDRDNAKFKSVAGNRKMTDDQFRSNIFRGRVTDADNNGLPFARVTNMDDNVGTYADARGYFNMLSPDTVLTVQVRSNGFNDNNIQLRNGVPNNQVIMQEDKSLKEVVVNQSKPNADPRRARNSNVVLEEPEPADGWDNYDTYISNNLNVPEEYKVKPSSQAEVEISFEVDKNGEPVNIRVEKSLCAKCDQEAIRLIKEGPKWKRKAKKGRTTVKVPFTGNY